MWAVLALGVAERVINQIIDLDMIAREQLNELQGQCLRVQLDVPMLSVDVMFDFDKVRLAPTATGQATRPSIFEQRPFDEATLPQSATATLRVANVVALCKLLLSREPEIGNIPVQGDYHLLLNLKQIIQHCELDIASAISPYVGAKVAHELARLQLAPQYVWQQCQNQAYAVQDYLKEDSQLFAPRWQLSKSQQQLRQLNQEIDRLEAKIQQLQQQMA
ncbi:MAG: hypothetical protein Q4D05_03755 [Acinetobacter sp.]|nr:hypothetical protein [Acinetobacter sp.]